jgi:hypothetical protein
MTILVLAFLTLLSPGWSQPSFPASLMNADRAIMNADRATVLKACAAEFGAPIDGKNNLFEVSRDYVLEAKFDNGGRLTQLGVLPKHWFADQHSEWDKTYDAGYFTLAEYKALLRRLERIQTKGQLTERARWPIVTHTVATRRDIYSSAVLVTSDSVPYSDMIVLVNGRKNTARHIKYFAVYFTK